MLAALALSGLFFATGAKALPGAEGIVGYQTGAMDQVEIGYSLQFQAADVGRPVQVYVLLQLDQTVLALDATGQFKPLGTGPVPFSTLLATTGTVKRSLVSQLRLLDLPAFKVVVGYGFSWEDMLAAQRFKQVFPLDDGSSTLAALPLPLTPGARQQADALLAQLALRLSAYNPTDPATPNNTDFLRAAAMYDQVVRAITAQGQQEERILREASETGQLALGQGESVTLPLDPAGQLPAFCTGTVTCRRDTDAETGEPQVTVVNTAYPTAANPTVPKTQLPTAAIDLPGLVQSAYPLSITLKRCMPWAQSCSSTASMNTGSLGVGHEALAAAVQTQAEAMLGQCASYVEGVYRSQSSPTYGNGDAALVSGMYLPVSRTYYLTCREVALFWTYTTGNLFEASVNADTGSTRTTAVASRMVTYADTKRLSVQKLAANLVVGQVPYLNVVNSGVKCLFGTSAVDMLINQFARTVNGIACRQAAVNLATSVIPLLKTIPIPIANTGSVTSALGISLAVIDGVEDFWSRASYAWTTSNARYGLAAR